MKRFSVITLLISLVWACTSDNAVSDEPAEVSFERGPMLVNWADNIIKPSYESFSENLTTLVNSFETFRADTNVSNLISYRDSWVEAYMSWQTVAMFEIGPAESVDFRFSMNTYPTNTDNINSHLASGEYDLSLSSNRSSKGFPALDYLINGLGDTDDEIVAKYTSTDKEELMMYSEDVLNDMVLLTTQVLDGWNSGYRTTFVENDGSSATASVDRFVNDYIFYFEKFLRAGKMGIPLGVFSGSPLPENVEAFYKADISKDLFLKGLQASQDFFNGKHFSSTVKGESLASYLVNLDTSEDREDLSNVINSQFDKSRELVVALDNFKIEIENNNPATNMLLAYDEVQRLVPLLKTDMVSAMSIGIDFVDADGD